MISQWLSISRCFSSFLYSFSTIFLESRKFEKKKYKPYTETNKIEIGYGQGIKCAIYTILILIDCSVEKWELKIAITYVESIWQLNLETVLKCSNMESVVKLYYTRRQYWRSWIFRFYCNQQCFSMHSLFYEKVQLPF